MTLSEYIDKYHYYKTHSNETLYARINVYPLSDMEIKDFLILDFSIKEIQNTIAKIIEEDKESLIPNYYKESKSNVFLLLEDKFLEKELITSELNIFFEKKYVIKTTDELLDLLMNSYMNAKKETYINLLKDLHAEINDKIQEVNNIVS